MRPAARFRRLGDSVWFTSLTRCGDQTVMSTLSASGTALVTSRMLPAEAEAQPVTTVLPDKIVAYLIAAAGEREGAWQRSERQARRPTDADARLASRPKQPGHLLEPAAAPSESRWK